jgi:hypothetical protein
MMGLKLRPDTLISLYSRVKSLFDLICGKAHLNPQVGKIQAGGEELKGSSLESAASFYSKTQALSIKFDITARVQEVARATRPWITRTMRVPPQTPLRDITTAHVCRDDLRSSFCEGSRSISEIRHRVDQYIDCAEG